jgi:ribonuclease E
MSSHSHSEDPQPKSLWKSMFSKLVGPDTSAPIKPLNDPDDLDGLDLDLLPPEKPKASPVAAAKSAPPKRELAEVTFDFDAEPDDEPVASGKGSEPAEVFFSDEEDAVDEELAPPAAAKPEVDEPPGDSYWDALAGLNPGDDAAEPSAAPRGGRGGRSGGRGGDRRGGGGGGGGGSGRRESSRGESRGESRRESRDERPSRGERSRSESSRSESSGRSSERPARDAGSSRPAPRPAPVNPDLFGDDDFGMGLTEESRAQIEAAENAPETDFDAPVESTDGGERTRRRRGRRGRRGRGREKAAEGTERLEAGHPADLPPDDGSDVDFEADVPAPRARSERPAPRSDDSAEFDVPAIEPAGDDDGFGAGLSSGGRQRRPARSEGERGRERSRGSRRGSSEPRERPASAGPASFASDAETGEDEGVETESAEERRDRYRNIPTWEEAISYLVKPKRRSRDSGRSGGGGRSRSSRSN